MTLLWNAVDASDCSFPFSLVPTPVAKETNKEYAQRIGRIWRDFKIKTTDSDEVKAEKTAFFRRLMLKVNKWLRDNPPTSKDSRAKTSMALIHKQLRAVINNAYDLHGISVVAFTAHVDAGVKPKIVGVKQAREYFAQALRKTRRNQSLATVSQSFWGHTIGGDPDVLKIPSERGETETSSLPPAVSILASLSKKTNGTWNQQCAVLATKLIDIIYPAVKAKAEAIPAPSDDEHDEEDRRSSLEAQWQDFKIRSKRGTNLPHRGLFDAIRDFDLEIRGWPAQAEDMLSYKGKVLAEYRKERDDTITITSGSLPQKN